VAEKQTRLAEVGKLYQMDPSNPYVFGEKAQLEYDIRQLEANAAFAQNLRSGLEAERSHFLQRLVVPVDDIEGALNFWRNGLGALVRSTRIVDGRNVTVVGFGPESLRAVDGAKFSVELVSAPTSVEGSQLQYIQLAMPVFRLSQAMAYGGDIKSAYGWTDLVAPGGTPLRVRIDETRRDPFEFAALRVSNLKAAVRHFEAFGMSAGEPFGKRKLSLLGNTAFEDRDAFEPDRELGATLMSYGDPEASTGLLLLPPLARKAVPLSPETRLFVIGSPGAGGTSSSVVLSPDGLPSVFESEPMLEARLLSEAS
jgi:hypothetical protein